MSFQFGKIIMRNQIVYIFFLLSTCVVFAQVENPVPDPIASSGKIIKLQDFATIPNSSNARPLAKINLLREAPDGSNRLFVNDLRGEFWVLNNGEPTLYVGLDAEFSSFIASPGFGTGFGAFAFHPDFANNGLFYTTHAESAGAATADYIPIEYDQITLQWVLTEWEATDPSANTFAGTKREILRFDYPGHTHGIQEIAFNPNATIGEEDYGLLYVCLGDGGSSLNYLDDNLQTIHSFLGTIFRIDPLGNNSVNGEYGIPPNNPFTTATDPDVVKEIYAYGFRNPHRISWDTAGDHIMLEGDIGEKNLEEVNLIQSGNNYGWGQREGTFLYDRSLGQDNVWELPADDAMYNYTYPVAQYDRDEGVAVIGGYVYRGSAIPDMYGEYIFGDIASGRVFHVAADELELGSQAEVFELSLLDAEGVETTLLEEVNYDRADLRFGVDNDGEIYILCKTDGKIRKVVNQNAVAVVEAEKISEVSWLSPNPGDGLFLFNAEKFSSEIINMTVLDSQGKVVWQRQFSSSPESIDLTDLPTGTYWVRWLIDELIFTQKIQKI